MWPTSVCVQGVRVHQTHKKSTELESLWTETLHIHLWEQGTCCSPDLPHGMMVIRSSLFSRATKEITKLKAWM